MRAVGTVFRSFPYRLDRPRARDRERHERPRGLGALGGQVTERQRERAPSGILAAHPRQVEVDALDDHIAARDEDPTRLADHGGRGYVDLRQAGPASNLALDGLVFWEARRAGVERVVFASSGCVYPNFLQGDPTQLMYLAEDLVKPPYDADNLYGYAKLMGELTLKAYAAEYGMKTASCRYFTVYGPRAKENHAVMAMIARAFVKQEPYELWGPGWLLYTPPSPRD